MAHPGARFSNTAELYDLVYHFKDYRGDAQRIAQMLVGHGLKGGAAVLEGACGTGAYLQFLRGVRRFGYDLDPAMLKVARARVPDATLWKADLARPDIPEPMDAILLLFGALGYVPPEALDACIEAHAQALAPGGLMLVEPWVAPDAFQPNRPHMATYETPFLKIARQVIPRLEDGWCVLDFHFLVSRPDFPVEHLQTTDRLYLHDHDRLEAALGRHLQVQRTQDGFMEDRVLFVERSLSGP